MTIGGAIISGLRAAGAGEGQRGRSGGASCARKESDLTRLGAFLDEHRNYVAPATFIYTLTPLPTNNLFIAAGMVGVNLGVGARGILGGAHARRHVLGLDDAIASSAASAMSSGRGRRTRGDRPAARQPREHPVAVPASVGTLAAARIVESQRDTRAAAAGGARPESRDRRRTNLAIAAACADGRPRGVALGGNLRFLGRPAERKREQFVMRTAEDVTTTMGDMKGAVMKFGQILSLMSGVVPDEMSAQLATLQSNAPPMSYHLVEQVFEREFGASPSKVFRKFEHEPFAAASIGQVHRATMHDGTRVAVKVQYPGVREAIDHDLANVGMLISMAGVLRAVSTPDRSSETSKRASSANSTTCARRRRSSGSTTRSMDTRSSACRASTTS